MLDCLDLEVVRYVPGQCFLRLAVRPSRRSPRLFAENGRGQAGIPARDSASANLSAGTLRAHGHPWMAAGAERGPRRPLQAPQPREHRQGGGAGALTCLWRSGGHFCLDPFGPFFSAMFFTDCCTITADLFARDSLSMTSLQQQLDFQLPEAAFFTSEAASCGVQPFTYTTCWSKCDKSCVVFPRLNQHALAMQSTTLDAHTTSAVYKRPQLGIALCIRHSKTVVSTEAARWKSTFTMALARQTSGTRPERSRA